MVIASNGVYYYFPHLDDFRRAAAVDSVASRTRAEQHTTTMLEYSVYPQVMCILVAHMTSIVIALILTINLKKRLN